MKLVIWQFRIDVALLVAVGQGNGPINFPLSAGLLFNVCALLTVPTSVCISSTIWSCRKPLNQWQHSFQMKAVPTLVNRFAAASDRSSNTTHGLYSLNGRTFYGKISWSLEAARLDVIIIVSLWKLTGISAALPPMCLSNFKAIWKV